MEQKLNIEIRPEQIQDIFASAIQRAVPHSDVEWDKRSEQLSNKVNKKAQWWRKLFRSGDVDRVRDVYEKKWTSEAALARFTKQAGDLDPIVWGDRRYFGYSNGIKRVHLFVLMRIIETLRPARVLEVGSGMGLNLLILAAQFPDVKFTGIELTSAGNEIAQTFRASPKLPDQLAAFSPLPIVNDQAHRAVSFFQGSAAQLPFEKNSFDLVYSMLALEQMEAIRDEVFGQIAAVCSGHVAMFEPFADWNTSPMRRHLIASRKFFAAQIADLPRYGLEPVFVSEDMPSKLAFGVGVVVARRVLQT